MHTIVHREDKIYKMCCLYLACLDHLMNCLRDNKDLTPKAWRDMQLQGQDDSSVKFIGTKFWKDVYLIMQGYRSFEIGTVWSTILAEINNIKAKFEEPQNRPPLLFAHDEARTLLDVPNDLHHSSFHAARIALDLFNDSTLFGLFVDTISKLTNIVPERKRNPSLRVNSDDGSMKKRLLPPFYQFDYYDIQLENYSKESNQIVNDPSISVAMNSIFQCLQKFASISSNPRPLLDELTKFMILFGRPGWKFAIDDMGTQDPNILYTFACEKMLGGGIPDNFPLSMSAEEAVALCGCSFVLNVLPDAKFAEDLVAKSMAVCLWIDQCVPERHRVYLSYNIEPFLSEASAHLIEMAGLDRILYLLLPLIGNQQVSPGPRGEFFTRMLVLTALRRCMPGKGVLARRLTQTALPAQRPSMDVITALAEEALGEEALADKEGNVSGSDASGTGKMESACPSAFKSDTSSSAGDSSSTDLDDIFGGNMNSFKPFHKLQPVTVKMFLSKLFPYKRVEACLAGQIPKEDMDSFLKGVVFANQFQPLTFQDIKEQHLKHFLCSGILVQCAEGQPFVDQLMPVLLPSGKMSFIGVQSRLYKGSDPNYKTFASEIPEKLYNIDLSTVPSLMIYFSMGYRTAELHALRASSKNDATLPRAALTGNPIVAEKMMCLLACGIDQRIFPFLSREEAQAFNDIKFCCLDRFLGGIAMDQTTKEFVRAGVLWRSFNGRGWGAGNKIDNVYKVYNFEESKQNTSVS